MMRLAAAVAVCACIHIAPANAANIAIALTDDRVEVDTSFAGARLTLFGAVSGVKTPVEDVDIISVIRGPETQFEIRQFEKKNLIWTPGKARIIENAPGLYITTATRPITDIAPLPDQAAYHLGADFLEISATTPDQETPGGARGDVFANAFLNEIEDAGLYHDRVGGIEFKKGALFAINVNLPANTPVGDYTVGVFLYQDGVLLGRDSAELVVNKVGIERRIYDLAHGQPVSYGILCVVLSLFAGWIAALAFRK